MRKWLRLLIAALLAGLVGFYPLLAPPVHRIDKHHAELVRQGMTFADVEAIFGQPPGNYDWAVADHGVIRLWDVAKGAAFNKKGYVVLGMDAGISNTLWTEVAATGRGRRQQAQYVTTLFLGMPTGGNTKTWTSRHGTCTVWFDGDGRVAGTVTDWGNTRIEPPWRKWWKKWFGE